MASAAKMAGTTPVRMLLMGYPGTGKTGALASLANAGYKLRILDFDGNPQSLLMFTDPDKLANIDILSFEDKMGMSGAYMGVKGVPTAFVGAVKAMDAWKYIDEGVEVNLGNPTSDWGADTILVVDGLTGLAKAAMNRAMALANQGPLNTTQATWGLAQKEIDAFTARITHAANRHHTIMLSHLKMIGPKMLDGKENMTNADLKEKAADLIPTRLCPSALGWTQPQVYAADWPITLLAEVGFKGKTPARTLQYQPRPEMELKLPVKDLAALGPLQIEDGLVRVFKALGHKEPQS